MPYPINSERLIFIVSMLKSLEEILTFDLIPEIEKAGQHNISLASLIKANQAENASAIEHLAMLENAVARLSMVLETLANDIGQTLDEINEKD